MTTRSILASEKVKITLVAGLSGLSKDKRLVIKSLGLTRVNSSRVHLATRSLVGQVNKVIQFVKLEQVYES